MYVNQLIIEGHAHERYCQRVEPISIADLREQVMAQRVLYHKRGYLKLSDQTWWRGSYADNDLTLHTCLGLHAIDDLPAALEWAKLHNDRIVLGGEANA